MRQPIREVGHIAAELLLEQFEGREPHNVIVPTELIVRSSSGPVVDHRARTRPTRDAMQV